MSGPAVLIEEGVADTRAPSTNGPVCPLCEQVFTPRRHNQLYCEPACQKRASRNDARGARLVENARRNRDHYDRASWLSYDVLRMSPAAQRRTILSDLEAASGTDAPLRNILLDPALLGADPWSPVGRFYPDTRCPDAPNIAKMVYAFCRDEWGVSTRQAILDDGKPAHRRFAEQVPQDVPCKGSSRMPVQTDRPSAPAVRPSEGYDWRKLARAMRDPGWRRYYAQDELDGFL